MEFRDREDEILRRMSAEQKLAVMHGLIRQAYQLKTASVRASFPELSEDDVRAKVRELVGRGGI